MGTNDDTLIWLPITLRDERYQYYNLAALDDNGQQSEHTWRNFWPDDEDDESESDYTSNFGNNDEIEIEDGSESDFDMDEDGDEWAKEEGNRIEIDQWE